MNVEISSTIYAKNYKMMDGNLYFRVSKYFVYRMILIFLILKHNIQELMTGFLIKVNFSQL